MRRSQGRAGWCTWHVCWLPNMQISRVRFPGGASRERHSESKKGFAAVSPLATFVRTVLCPLCAPQGAVTLGNIECATHPSRGLWPTPKAVRLLRERWLGGSTAPWFEEMDRRVGHCRPEP